MNHLRPHLFFNTALLFFIAQTTALVVADQLQAIQFPVVSAADFSPLFYFLASFFAATLFLLILFQVYRGSFLYRLLFILAAFFGLMKVFEIVFPVSLAMLASLVFISGLFIVPTVWAHDIIVIIAAAGIGPIFGLQFTVTKAALLLLILCVYDVAAVYWTKHMVTLAHEMVKHKASFALIIPEHYRQFKALLSQVVPGSGFLILGGGDVILPMFFTVPLFLAHPQSAYWAVTGELVGLYANHLWLMTHRKALPALPFIVLGAFVGAGLFQLMALFV